jgi:hypothetical protein
MRCSGRCNLLVAIASCFLPAVRPTSANSQRGGTGGCLPLRRCKRARVGRDFIPSTVLGLGLLTGLTTAERCAAATTRRIARLLTRRASCDLPCRLANTRAQQGPPSRSVLSSDRALLPTCPPAGRTLDRASGSGRGCLGLSASWGAGEIKKDVGAAGATPIVHKDAWRGLAEAADQGAADMPCGSACASRGAAVALPFVVAGPPL